MAYLEYEYIDFEWDDNKAESNQRKHNVSFELAIQAFFDENCITQTDFIKDGEQRWKTLGLVNGVVLLFVGHLLYNDDEKEVVRIITARKATAHERKEYYGTR